MSEIAIQIDWVYALGILGSLLVIAWHSGSRFSRIDASLSGIKEKIHDMKEAVDQRIDDIKTDLDNARLGAYGNHSPIQLTQKGEDMLVNSGLQEYIEHNKTTLLANCPSEEKTNPYEIQEHIFSMFNDFDFGEQMDNQLKKYAYEQGIPMDILRRVGAIYFRNICLQEYHMNAKEIDMHNQISALENHHKKIKTF